MKLIVGLGNPGRLYANTRHNIGSNVVRSLAKKNNLTFRKNRITHSEEAKGIIGDEEVILAVPLTYMNMSGMALSSLVERYKVKLEDLLIVCDDLDLELGRLKIRPFGSSAGHKGLNSIIEDLKTDKVSRLRLGIGRPNERGREADFVLSRFKRTESKIMDSLIKRAMDCCQMWIRQGTTRCMEIFNRREKE